MDSTLLVAIACFLGMLAVLTAIDTVRDVRRRWQCHRLPGARGYLRLVDKDGKPFLVARLPVDGLRTLLEDYQRGRLG